MVSYNSSISRIKVVANALAELSEKTVFVGGATVSLYATDSTARESRTTDDVDVVVEIVSYADYALFEEKLRAVGFSNDTESRVICRYKIQGIIVDIMPIDDSVLGFSNVWYKEGMTNAIEINILETTKILIFEPPYFLASKLEALKSRGMSDIRYSSDFEDIIYLFDNRNELLNELLNAKDSIKEYLQAEFSQLLQLPIIQEAIEANVEQDFVYARANKIIEIWQRFVLK